MSPANLDGIERTYCQVARCETENDIGAGSQVEYITHIYNEQLCLLNQMRKQGLIAALLLKVFQTIVLSRIQYASPAWYGYVSQAHIQSIQNMLVKAKRSCFQMCLQMILISL